MRHITAILSGIVLAVIVGCSPRAVQGPEAALADDASQAQTQLEGWQSLLGSWGVTSGQKSLVICLYPDGRAMVLSMQPGQHSTTHVPWEPFHGGILVHGMPRMRLWLGRHDRELRAEIESVPEHDYDPDEEFLSRFFMRRIGDRRLPEGWKERPVPPEWERETLDEEWNASAGRKRPVPKEE